MTNTLITQDRLDTFRRNGHLIPPGLIIEVGVYKGGSLKYLSELFPDRQIYGFDTFEGLPAAHHIAEEHHEVGEFSDTTIDAVREFIDSNNVHLVSGLFPDSFDYGTAKKIALAHIDTDYYLSVKACIEFILPRMVKGGMIIFDDYGWSNCQGVERAIKEANLPIVVSAEYQALYLHR